MATDKIIITDKLRLDIIERRKNRGISSYELSERTGNGHSKFWLQNIESGKTQKISKQDLIALYMAIENNSDEESATYEVERVLNQTIGDTYKEWHELVTISEDYAEIYDEDDLMDALEELFDEKIVDNIRNTVFGMSTNQKQAALTALQNFSYSLYKNPDLAFALINIPVYGVNENDHAEYSSALNDLLAINAKYNDLVIKNKSIETIKEWNEFDAYYATLDRETIHIALNNFKDILHEIMETSNTTEPDFHELKNKFNVNVTFLIERGQPNVTKHYLKSFRIHSGKGFVKHIKECASWFLGFQREYDLPFIYDVVNEEFLNSLYTYLDTIGEIKHTLK